MGIKFGTKVGFLKAAAILLAATLTACVAATVVTSEKAYAYGINQAGATSNSVTISWADPNAGSTSYKTTNYKLTWGKDYNSLTNVVNLGTAASYTISGLKPGTSYYARVEYDYTRVSTGEKRSSTIGSSTIATRVVKPTGVKQTKWWYYAKSVDFTWNKQDAATKLQFKVCKASNGKTVKTETRTYPSDSLSMSKVSNNVVYTAQVRVQDAYGWSPWSDKAYLFTQPMATSKTKATNGKLTVAWGKINGATSYSVYVSNKEKKGYKKVSTVKSTKNKITVKKFKGAKISKKKTYYVYVVANKKVGGKTYTSGKHYTYKVKGSSGSLRWTFD